MEEKQRANAMSMGAKGQHELRKTIIRMLKDGKSGKQVEKELSVSEGHVSNVKKLYEKGGASALKLAKRGKPTGKNKILTPEQEREIQQVIVDKTPEQMRFKECMWTRNNIRQLIMEKYGIDIKPSTLGYYLARWGFSVQRPVKRAYKQDEKKIDAWLNSEFPGITERAETEGAEIFFGDETNIQNTANDARGYAPKGKTPVVRTEAQKLKIEMLSAVPKRGKLHFLLYKGSMNSEKHCQYTAKDECTRWTYREMYAEHSTYSSQQFLLSLIEHAPFMIWEVQTDNGTEFTKRLISNDPNDKTLFELELGRAGIIHHLLRPATPRHNGKVERQHRIDELRFYRNMKMYSLEDGRKQDRGYRGETLLDADIRRD